MYDVLSFLKAHLFHGGEEAVDVFHLDDAVHPAKLLVLNAKFLVFNTQCLV